MVKKTASVQCLFFVLNKMNVSLVNSIKVAYLQTVCASVGCACIYTTRVVLSVFQHVDSQLWQLNTLQKGRANFSERGTDETFRSSSSAGVPNENPKMRMYIHPHYMYITILLLQSRQISEATGAACHEEVFKCPA